MPYGGYNMFIYDASNINWHKFDLFKYIVIDGKYKLYRDKDFTVYRDGISLIEGTSFYNIPLRTGMRVDFVFGADYY